MRIFELLLNVMAPIAAAVIVVRAGCILSRMQGYRCLHLLVAYFGLGISAFAVMLIPCFGREASALGYPGFIISAAAVILLDQRLRNRPKYDHT